MSRGRRFTITLNNPACNLNALITTPGVSYLIAAEEFAPSTGTRHFQIYLETTTKHTTGALAKELTTAWNSHPHVLCSKGTQAQNRAYVMKTATTMEGCNWVECGTPMTPGARTDLEAVTAAIAGGSSLRELWDLFPTMMIRYGSGIRACYDATSPHRMTTPPRTYTLEMFARFGVTISNLQTALLGETSIVLWGEPGIGKTCLAQTLIPNALFVTHTDDLLRYDAATHGGIIFDDMSFMHLPREAQIQVFDREQTRSIHCRYQTATIPAGTPKIFTTNNNNGSIYLGGDGALARRITVIEMVHDMEEEGEGFIIPDWLD